MDSKAKNVKFMVCHDGSDASQNALETVKDSLLKEHDELVVAHAWNEAKEEYLPYKFKRAYIRQQNLADFTYLGKRFDFLEEEITNGKTTKDVLNGMAKLCHADVAVVGYHGRKGPKEDPTLMGSAVQYLSTKSEAPVMIIKDPKSRKDRGAFMFAVCVDGSKASIDCLKMLIRFRHSDDKVYVIICEQQNIDSAHVKTVVSEVLEEQGCLEHSQIMVLSSQYGKRTKDIIREHITETPDLYIDYIFVGNKGADFSGSKDHYLGSVANEIIRHTKLNTVFIC